MSFFNLFYFQYLINVIYLKELKKVRNEVEEQKFIVSKQVETEKTLSEQAKSLVDVADCATVDINLLHNTVEKKK